MAARYGLSRDSQIALTVPCVADGGLAAMVGLNSTGANTPSHVNRQPYLGLNFIISLFGIYPSPN